MKNARINNRLPRTALPGSKVSDLRESAVTLAAFRSFRVLFRRGRNLRDTHSPEFRWEEDGPFPP
jgi:hypothetical protein